MRLSLLKSGQKARLVNIESSDLRVQAIRFGIEVGQLIECIQVIPSGPIIIKKRNQEIAIGRELAHSIKVTLEG